MYVTKKVCGRLTEAIFSATRACSEAVRDFRDIPSPRGLPIIGTRLAILAAGSSKYIHEYIDKRHRELGPIYRERLGPITGVFVAEPDSIRSIFSQEGKHPIHIIPQSWTVYNKKHNYTRGLFFMNGPEWLEHRRIMNNLLLKGDLTWMEEAADAVITNFVEDLKGNVITVETLDRELYKAFLEVLVSVLLGADTYKKYKTNINTLVNELTDTVQLVFETTMKLEMINAEWAEKLGLSRWKIFETAMSEALTGAEQILDTLTEECGYGNGLLRRMRDHNVHVERINAIVADLFLAAGDTTAYTMQWILYLVSKNKHVQDKIRSELTNPGSNYTKHVLKETLRLYPVAPFLTRFLPHESQISGYKIPENSLIIMSIYSTGRNEKYFENPLEFIPERWDRANKSMVTKQASLPFAMGSRSCVGKKLAEYELHLMLLRLVENFHLDLCNTNDVHMVMKMIAAPSEPIRLRLRRIR
ncbi:cytochrome P450 315a1, mitochondrial [Coccinella septempunctata]|uniref:cytochrome P450 315a1, mitochondrial n=1 Tax=Coccinella septempunctata TaxID=41139 RepID=UPI001D072AE0|nr:cytochrome P450 315a1, mitochondrial [Coccinella septempunctata]